jgi:hypothetical protein
MLSGREKPTVFHTALIGTSNIRNITHFGVREQYITLQANVNICMISGFSHGANEIAFFWDFTQRRLVGYYRRFGATYQFYLKESSSSRRMPRTGSVLGIHLGPLDPWRRNE